MAAAGDARVLWSLLRGLPRGRPHAAALQAFYAPQARQYDAFRERLLHGRTELLQRLDTEPGQTLVDLGAGTGRSVDLLGDDAARFARIDLVDLCPALLEVAARRCAGHGNTRLVQGDAAAYDPGQPVDRVLFCYSLSMMPDWRAALANACRMLQPGGRVGVVDFCPPAGRIAGAFWRSWFGHDGVRLDRAHQVELCALFEPLHFVERRGRVPFLPLLRAPYYLFVGRRPG